MPLTNWVSPIQGTCLDHVSNHEGQSIKGDVPVNLDHALTFYRHYFKTGRKEYWTIRFWFNNGHVQDWITTDQEVRDMNWLRLTKAVFGTPLDQSCPDELV